MELAYMGYPSQMGQFILSYNVKYEPGMMGYGTHQSVMPRHDAEAFAQGCLPVLGGHSLFQIVDEGEMGIVQGPCLLHHPDAPVEVGGEAVLQLSLIHI